MENILVLPDDGLPSTYTVPRQSVLSVSCFYVRWCNIEAGIVYLPIHSIVARYPDISITARVTDGTHNFVQREYAEQYIKHNP